MFFIGIFGIGSKEKTLREWGAVACPQCGQLSRAVLTHSYSYFHIFFIPTFRWNKRYLVTMRCCGAVYEADAAYAQMLKNASDIDFSRLKKISGGFGDAYGGSGAVCTHCGARIDSGFAWCPHCGTKRG